jgi:peptide deformylase
MSSVSRIHLFPATVLRKPSQRVTFFDTSIKKIVKSLALTMESQPSGIGIAAPQIGLSLRVALVDVSARVQGAERLVLINPVILETREEILSREGCMSLPEYTAYLKRYHWVRVEWQTEEGKKQRKTSIGIEAICIQHEIDHLDGIMFIDRVVSLKTDMIPRKLRKLAVS